MRLLALIFVRKWLEQRATGLPTSRVLRDLLVPVFDIKDNVSRRWLGA
jgi:hypothetical protein